MKHQYLLLLLINLFCFLKGIDTCASPNLDFKIGLGPTYTFFKSDTGYISRFWGIGIGSHFGYRFQNIELAIGSYSQFTIAEDIELQTEESYIRGKGNMSGQAFGPKILIYLPHFKHDNFTPFIFSSYMIGIQSFWFSEALPFYDLQNEKAYKLTFETNGYALGSGVESHFESFPDYPYYIEMAYKYQRARKKTLVGGTTMLVKEVWHNESHVDVSNEKSFYLIFGIQLF